jgi:transcriptional regulator of acetoin/glycerol metabolism
MLPRSIAESWLRCTGLGLPAKGVDFTPCASAELRAELENHANLLDHATPVMEMLYQQIIDSHSMVVLTNASGFILHSLGDDSFLDRANRVSLMPGINWNEDSKGTNAIGTALVEEAPVVIHGHQHYFSTNHILTCSASPIQDPLGKVIGVLDVTGDHRSYSPHTLALVKMSVRLVENQMFAHAFPDAMVVHFHSRPEYLGTICEGMIAFSPDGQTLAANQNAYTQLNLRQRDVTGSCFEQIFNQ